LGIDLFKSVLMYSNGAICLIKLLFKIGLFTVHRHTCVVYTVEACIGRCVESGPDCYLIL
jgi:hypothetical protein